MSGIVDSKHPAIAGFIEKYGIENAVIEKTTLGIEDHGFFMNYLHLKFLGGGQGFGGRVMSSYDKIQKRQVGHAFGCDYLIQMLDVIRGGDYENLKGKHIRIVHSWSEIFAIGHIIEDRWFVPSQLAREHFGERVDGGEQTSGDKRFLGPGDLQHAYRNIYAVSEVLDTLLDHRFDMAAAEGIEDFRNSVSVSVPMFSKWKFCLSA